MQEDIAAQLGFGRDAVQLVSSFDRPNISYSVRYVDNLPHEVRCASYLGIALICSQH